MKRSHVHALLWPFVSLALVLVGARLALPSWIRHHLDERIERMGPYHGSMSEVDLHIWRGSYTIRNLRIDKVGTPSNEPFLDAPRTEIAVSYTEALRGRLRGHVDFYNPTVNFIDGKSESEQQLGNGVNWSNELNILIPAELDSIRVHNGTITFRNVVSNPRVDLTIANVNSTITNLSASQSESGVRTATLHGTATVLGDAPLETHATFDPTNRFGNFHYQIRISQIQLVRANALARAYSGLDFAGGTGDFTMDLKATNGHLEGYAKPVFKDLKLFSWKKDVEQEKKGPIKLLYEAAAQGAVSLLKGPSNDQLVTNVPISGRIGDSEFSKPQAIFNVVHDAFLHAYKSQLEHLQSSPDETSH
ncbi:hypothetical protein GCM10007862_10470 [Dyella lipolytica]|uniref:DUF748 domain-containing protein n=1 Tax=Dyella lipolytica TaxID=1867835 RepID=A0ABW8IXN4_9GAMM|nr:DUF748 domain-containing protein [Dyella lipolytica]GLQ45996.1 hypothetical protein GCM10007862_10470 [Dyella lipolytica]